MSKSDTAVKWQRYRKAGCKALQTGHAIKAESLLSIALKQAEKFGQTDIRVAVSLQDLAECYWQAGDYGPAEALYKRCLQIKKRVAGADHPDVAKTVHRLEEVQALLHTD